jgi:integrase
MTEQGRKKPSRGASWRTSENGAIRFNRDFSRNGIGRITNSSRTSDPKEFARRDALLTKLHDWGQFDALRAFKRGDLSIEELIEADREGRLNSADLQAYLTLKRPLWKAIDDTLPRMGKSPGTRSRYKLSLTQSLKKKASNWLPESARVQDLERVRWDELRAVWGKSHADWNHMRRALSAFLTVLFDDKYNPFRRRIMKAVPIATEVGRVPDLTPEVFWKIMEHVPERLRASFVVLVGTGLRVRSEYLRLTRFNLKPATFSIAGVGTKTETSAEDVAVYPPLWPYVERAVPAPVGYKALRRAWAAACEKVGVALRIHDLRHCYGQWAVNSGVPESKVQSAMRHKTAAMTRRYTLTQEKGEASSAVGKVLLREDAASPAQVAAQGDTHA